jgi:hypothetical protein
MKKDEIYKDFAKVFLDVIKYVLTGVILSSFISDMGNTLMVYVASSAVIIGALGLYLFFCKMGGK